MASSQFKMTVLPVVTGFLYRLRTQTIIRQKVYYNRVKLHESKHIFHYWRQPKNTQKIIFFARDKWGGRKKFSLPTHLLKNSSNSPRICLIFPHWWLMSDRLHQVAPYSESFGDIHVLLIAQIKEHSSNVSSLPGNLYCVFLFGAKRNRGVFWAANLSFRNNLVATHLKIKPWKPSSKILIWWFS